MIIKFFIYRNKLIKKAIEITNENILNIEFMLENELKKIRKRLNYYKKRGIIDHIYRDPKIYKLKFRQKIKDINYSRRNIIEMIYILKSTRLKYKH